MRVNTHEAMKAIREAMLRHHQETGHTDCKFLRKLARQEILVSELAG